MTNGVYVMSRVSTVEEPQQFVVNVAPEKTKSKPIIDEDGFQQVTKKQRKEKRELTEAEIAAKYAHIPEEEENADYNADLMETGHRDWI
jgi:uncharacterized Fe-S center protein